MAQEDRDPSREEPKTSPDRRDAIKTATVEAQQGLMPTTNTQSRTAPPSDTATPPEPIAYRPSPQDRLPPQVGSTVKHYEILRKLGEGAMGTVYLARDTTLGRLVAIKVLRVHTGPSAERFLIEAQATARCRHDNIVVIHEVDDHDGYPYMVLEYLEGRTLREWMAQRHQPAEVVLAETDTSGLVSPSLAVELMLPVVRALACAHKLGIVHRDLKPENIFLTATGRVVVLDFGIAKRLDVSELSVIQSSARLFSKGARLTQEGALIGTLPYMSPEQLRSEDIDACSDLWTVGIILYELIAGAHPLGHRSVLELLEIAASDDPMPSVRDDRPDAGPLGAIIDRCLRKQRNERYRSAEELLGALEALGAGHQGRKLGEDRSPFAGLAAFQEADAPCFVGRDHEVVSLTERLRNQPLMVVAGPSGAGKSSFVRAGVIPALKRSGERWEALILRPGRRPLAALAELFAQVAPAPEKEVQPSVSERSASDALLGVFHTQPGVVGARLRERCRRAGSGHRILIFVDQFEELYTLGSDAAERASFVACLESAADDASSPLRVILSIRSDFHYRMAEEGHFLAEATRALFFLRPMDRDGLREALTRPLEAVGYRFEDATMIQGMIRGLEHTKGALPLLQFTASRLWEARDRTTRLLTQASYQLLGGVAGALSAHANAVLSALPLAEQRICRTVFLRLCTPERTRAVVSLSDLRSLDSDSAAVEQVIHRLCDARLVIIEAGGEREGTTVEICHEALIDSWDKFQQWLSESAQDAQFLARLSAAAQQWETSQEAEGLLWRDRAAREAADWLARRRAEQGPGALRGLVEREERFLLSVVALSDRTRRWRQRIMVGMFAAVGVIASIVFILSLGVKRQATRADRAAVRAEQAALLAQHEARQARNATRMALARELEEKDPTTMLALLREIEPPGVPRDWADLASRALRSGLARDVRNWGKTVYSAAWSPDGQRIVAALEDGTAWAWRVGDTAESIVPLGDDPVYPAYSVTFSPDGTRIVIASGDKTAQVWNVGLLQPVVLNGHEGVIHSATFSPDGTHILTASEDKTVRLWNVDGSGQPVMFVAHDGGVNSAAFSRDGRRIVTASEDKTARVWNVDGSGQPIVLRGHEGPVETAAFSPDGQRVVTGSTDATIRVWNADGTGQPVVLRGHEDWVKQASFSPDGQRIATASKDKTVRVWNADGSGAALVLRGHESCVYTAAWSPDGASIVTASLDQTTRVFRADNLEAPVVLRGYESGIWQMAFSSDGRRVVAASGDNTALVWNADGSGQPVVLRGHEGLVYAAAFSPDHQRIVTASEDRTVRVWSADGLGQSMVLRGHDGPVHAAAFSPDNQRIVTASDDKTARVWNADGSGKPVVLRGHEGKVTWAAFSPEGKHVATGSDDETVRMWNVDGAGEVKVYRGYTGMIAWSPDGKRIIVGGRNKTARVWSIDNSEDPVVLQAVAWAAWSPDGKRIVTASDDATARIWNADGSGQPVVLRGHEQELSFAAFSSDGDRILTISLDGTARVWNADGTGEPYVLSFSHGQGSISATWSPDGAHVVAHVRGDNTARVWPVHAPLRGIDDPRLWAASSYCMTIERRIALLSVSEVRARADQEACERRVQAAGAATTRH